MPPTPDLLLQMIQQNDAKAEDSHTRLRETMREHEGWLARLERTLNEQAAAITLINATPVEAAQLHFSPSVVLAIVTICLTVATGMWASTYGLRSDVRDILTKQDSATKLQDERSQNLHEAIEAVKRRQELQQIELQELKSGMASLTRAIR